MSTTSHNLTFMFRLIVVAITLLLIISCHHRVVNRIASENKKARYASGVPAESQLKMLNTIGLSVKKLSCYAEYTTWVFSRSSGVKTGSDFTARSAQALRVMRTPESILGTATILSYSSNKVLVITCAHVVDYPDTIYTFHEPDITGEPLVYTASIKKSQINYVKEIPVAGGLSIIAIDNEADLALLGGTLSAGKETPPPLSIFIGKSAELARSNRAWVFGFPIGYMMLTEALVNNPGFDNRGGFMLDAVFNPGFSGGLTIAFNLNTQKFEVVGLGRSAPSSMQLVLTPAGTPGLDHYPPCEPYTDKVFVQQRAELAYGLTFATSSEAILKFIHQYRIKLLNDGYDLSFAK